MGACKKSLGGDRLLIVILKKILTLGFFGVKMWGKFNLCLSL